MKQDYLFLENIAIFLKQGYSMHDILRISKISINHPAISQLEDLLQEGTPLVEAILTIDISKDFKEYFVFFKLQNDISKAILDSISICKEKHMILTKIKKEMTYPIFLIIFLLFFSVFVIMILLPQINSLFAAFSIEQAWYISLLYKGFSMIPLIIIIAISIGIGLLIDCIRAIKKQHFHRIDKYLTYLPLFSKYIKMYYTIKFAIYYSEFLRNGYDSTTIIETLYHQVEDSDIKMVIYELYQDVIRGIELSKAVEQFPYFELAFKEHFRLLIENIATDKSLEVYIQERIKQLHSSIEKGLKKVIPLVYGFVGTFIILVYVSIILPMMDIVNLV